MCSKSLYFGPRHDFLTKIWPSNRFGLPMAVLDDILKEKIFGEIGP
jgi:hypothetical protein